MKHWLSSSLLILALGLFGCASIGIDWNRQVGEMTFDQAISLLGTPDQSEKTDDGKIIAEWTSHYAPEGQAMESDDTFRYHSAAVRESRSKPDIDESCLRLTFGTNAVLIDWSKN
jgi:hypothetical protein